MTLYERIEKLRNLRGISQGDLEKELGFSNGSISKWKKSTPNPQRLEKLASYFGVTSKFLLGEEDEVECKECGQKYNPFDEFDMSIHNRFHNQIISAQEKYPFLVPYRDCFDLSHRYLESIQKDSDNYFENLGNYIKAEFSYYVYLNYENKNLLDYDNFCKSQITDLINSGKIPEKRIEQVIKTYGLDKSLIDIDGATLARISSNPQLMRLLKYAEMLSPTFLDALEAQAKAWSESSDNKSEE